MLWNSLPAQGFQLRFAEFSPKVPKFVSKQNLFGYFLEANVPLASVLPELCQRLALNQSEVRKNKFIQIEESKISASSLIFSHPKSGEIAMKKCLNTEKKKISCFIRVDQNSSKQILCNFVQNEKMVRFRQF